MIYETDSLNKNFRNSNKDNVLAIISRFFKERRCWTFFRERCLNSAAHIYDAKYFDLYANRPFRNGIEDFERRLKGIKEPKLFLSSRSMLCFEYNDEEFEEGFCETLSKQFGDMLIDKKINKTFKKYYTS